MSVFEINSFSDNCITVGYTLVTYRIVIISNKIQSSCISWLFILRKIHFFVLNPNSILREYIYINTELLIRIFGSVKLNDFYIFIKFSTFWMQLVDSLCYNLIFANLKFMNKTNNKMNTITSRVITNTVF